MPAVLFVCTANICRSPMASALFKEMLREKQTPGEWQVESAGTWAMDGQPVSEGSQSVMAERGIDISDHRSQSVNQELLESFDLVLTMEWGHKEAMQIEFPALATRIHLLSEMAGKSGNVDDPYGGPMTGYEETAEKIEELLTMGYEKIIQLAGAEVD